MKAILNLWIIALIISFISTIICTLYSPLGKYFKYSYNSFFIILISIFFIGTNSTFFSILFIFGLILSLGLNLFFRKKSNQIKKVDRTLFFTILFFVLFISNILPNSWNLVVENNNHTNEITSNKTAQLTNYISESTIKENTINTPKNIKSLASFDDLKKAEDLAKHFNCIFDKNNDKDVASYYEDIKNKKEKANLIAIHKQLNEENKQFYLDSMKNDIDKVKTWIANHKQYQSDFNEPISTTIERQFDIFSNSCESIGGHIN